MKVTRASFSHWSGVLLVAIVFTACGKNPPGTDHQRRPGGTVSGAYILRIQPAAGCGAPAATFSLPVRAFTADTAGFHAVQILSRDVGGPFPPAARLVTTPPLVELELRYVTNDVTGAMGTAFLGVPAQEGFQVWVRAIASGPVTNLDGAPGEVMEGTLMGELEFGRDAQDEAGLGLCESRNHHWSLKLS